MKSKNDKLFMVLFMVSLVCSLSNKLNKSERANFM